MVNVFNDLPACDNFGFGEINHKNYLNRIFILPRYIMI